MQGTLLIQAFFDQHIQLSALSPTTLAGSIPWAAHLELGVDVFTFHQWQALRLLRNTGSIATRHIPIQLVASKCGYQTLRPALAFQDLGVAERITGAELLSGHAEAIGTLVWLCWRTLGNKALPDLLIFAFNQIWVEWNAFDVELPIAIWIIQQAASLCLHSTVSPITDTLTIPTFQGLDVLLKILAMLPELAGLVRAVVLAPVFAGGDPWIQRFWLRYAILVYQFLR